MLYGGLKNVQRAACRGDLDTSRGRQKSWNGSGASWIVLKGEYVGDEGDVVGVAGEDL